MKLLSKAVLCLFCLSLLAACGPNATAAAPTPTEPVVQQPTRTPRPTKTPRPTSTPNLPPATSAAETPAGQGTPETAATQSGEAQPGAAQPTAATPAANPAAGAAGKAPEKYTYLGQNVADRTQFLPNRPVTVTWTIKNSGTNGWTKEYMLRYFSGPKPAKDFYYFTKDVPVNDTINFTVTFTTPADPGDYDLWFKLTNAAGQNFGDLDLVFTVSNNPQKATATPAK